jgi:alpha-glucan,water dikinase
LQEEVANGTSLDALKARLLKGEGSGSSNGTAADDASVSSPELPDELIQVQSFVRWEKAGKPNYTAEEQLVILLTGFVIA